MCLCSDCLDCAGWFKPVIFWSVTGGLAGLLSLLVIGKIRKGREGFKEKKRYGKLGGGGGV